MSSRPVYIEQDIDTRIALHLGINRWDLSYGGRTFYCKLPDLASWTEHAQRHLSRFGNKVYADMVPTPSWWPHDDRRGFIDNHEDEMWQQVAVHIRSHGLYENFLNCLANQCPSDITYGWWLVTATARQKLDIAEDFLFRSLGDPLDKIDWEKYIIKVATPDVPT